MFLHVRAVEAKDVPIMDYFGKSDPYLYFQVSTSSQKWKTNYINDTVNPCWKEEFHIPITSDNSDKLHVELYDYDRFTRDDLISSYDFDVKDFPVGKIIDKWYDFNPAKGVKTGGSVRLMFHLAKHGWEPFIEQE
ncbi:Protein Aster-C [Tritrichomonas musculus]|uniref:Protein Aster-C n=1 Tax=Tritrichomonas musculus TaxID=1915356 RepID=A0ABR2JD51_9EUKA